MNRARNRTAFWLVYVLITLAVIPGCFSSCTTAGPDYTTVPPQDVGATNAIRNRIGIRPIKDSWRFLHRQWGEETWLDSHGRECKVAKRDENEHIAWEFDDYY